MTAKHPRLAEVAKRYRIVRGAASEQGQGAANGPLVTWASAELRAMNLAGRVAKLFEDIRRLREYSMTPEGRVKDPQIFAQAIAFEERAISTGLRRGQEIYDLERMSEFYDALIAEVGEVSPEVARKIIDRLDAINNTRAAAGKSPMQEFMQEQRR